MENSSSFASRHSFRLLKSNLPELYSSAEMQGLSALVLSAPGVNSVSEVVRHPKGGYSVTLQISKSAIEAALLYLASNGYRAAV
jgi:hypothetical protein